MVYTHDVSRTVDRRQRAFKNMDTCAQDGYWVEESQYNRHNGKKVLVGNWQEEQTIHQEISSGNDIQRGPPHLQQQANFKRPKCNATVSRGYNGKVESFLNDNLPVQTKQGERSTLLMKGSDEDFIKATTTKKFEYPHSREESTVGVRKKIEERKLLEQAARDLDSQESTLASSFKKAVAEETYKTTYKIDHTAGQDKSINSGLSKSSKPSYVSDQPITFYSEAIQSKSPVVAKLHTSVYHTKTNRNGSPFMKNSTFSKPISEYYGGPTKDF